MIKEHAGAIFSIAQTDRPIPGCTVSRLIYQSPEYNISHFSLAEGTSISPESYRYPILWICLDGDLEPITSGGETACTAKGVRAADNSTGSKEAAAGVPAAPVGEDSRPLRPALHPGDAFLTPVNRPIGSATQKGCVYTAIHLKEDTTMNKTIHAGEIFALKDLLPYQDGKIINMDLIDDPKLKLVVMSFDAGTGLPEHAAPGEALIFALDGEAVIGYEGKQYPIHAGENFKFDKGGAHSVTANKRFKMALLLTLE